MQVRGDVFVARTFDNEDDFKRLDFTLSEVSSRAAWVKEARAQNERKAKVDSHRAACDDVTAVAMMKISGKKECKSSESNGRERVSNAVKLRAISSAG